MWKIGIVAVGLLCCAAMVGQDAAAAAARGVARGGGGVARVGGGGFRGGGGLRSFGGGRAFHPGGARAFHHFGGARIGGLHSIGRRASLGHISRGGGLARSARFSRFTGRVHGRQDLTGAFARHGLLHANRGIHRFAHAGFRHHGHIGWYGSLFWPYAYGDFFYYSLWPSDYGYDNPFWAYGYNDIYESLFWPYSYGEFVRGRRGRARLDALTVRVGQTCAEEAGEVTGWPIDQIREVVQPNEQQRATLDALGDAIVKASQTIRAGCPTSIAFTPTGRLEQMQKRVEALIQAVSIVRPAVANFYEQLSDEQKARFNAMGAPGGEREGTERTASARPDPQAACRADVTPWPTDAIERVVHPTDAQRAKLDGLKAAAAKAADLIKASCPAETPLTPPDRLAAVAKRLDAVLQGVQTVRAAVDDFYSTLSDEQKARFNALGVQRSSSR
jgi:hypothetical protein